MNRQFADMSINAIDSKKLVEALLGDLRLLSQEAKKKQNHVKESAESGVVRIRNISTASVGDTVLITNLRAACTELLQPLILACETRYTRLVQIALQGIQRLVQHRILSGNGATIVTNELWALVEAECEELRVLQTVPPLVSSELVVTGNTLAKCIVMCFRLHFAKDPIVINAASAAVRQLVSTVFERVIQEDGIFSSELTVVNPAGGRPSARAAPPTLRPCAADAYMLFRDLCLLINGEAPIWLVGIQEMTRTLGLELLESLLKGYPSVFIRHVEFGGLLKDDVCPLIIRLFSPNVKAMHISSQHPASRNSAASMSNYPPTISHERQSFPISMRLVRIVTLIVQFYQNILHTECEIFISTLLKFVDGDRKGWQRPLALESLHRIVSSTDLVKWMTESFDCRPNSTHVLEQVAVGLSTVVQQCLVSTTFSSDQENELERSQEDGGPGFLSKGLWVPYVEHLTAKKSILLDSLDRMDAVPIPEGYVLSRCCVALCDMTQAVYAAIDNLCLPDENQESSEAKLEVAKVAYTNSQPSILAAIGSLLAASSDEMVSDQLLCCLSTLISAGCRVGAGPDLHRSVYVLAIMSLPSPSYLNQFAAIAPPSATSKRDVAVAEQVFDMEAWPSTAQVTATGPPCPCPVVSTELWNKQVLLTSKNMQAARTFIASITTYIKELNNLSYLCLATCEHLSWLLAMRPTQVGQFERETRDDHSNGPTVVTNAALAGIGMLSSLMDKVAPAIAALPDDCFLSVIDSLIRLSDESLAVAATGRESSLFPLAVLYKVCVLSLPRLDVFWQKTANHFIKVCGFVDGDLIESILDMDRSVAIQILEKVSDRGWDPTLPRDPIEMLKVIEDLSRMH
uniref:Protein MON2 homolog n=2 Tax=Caenorhabditis japonica TaxID=281687 RepID=A0A8R1EK54_CAEJA